MTPSQLRALGELTGTAVSALKAHCKRQIEERIEFDSLWEDHGLIFATERGTITNPSNLRGRSFIPFLKRAGLPETVRFHDIRHTCATLLLRE